MITIRKVNKLDDFDAISAIYAESWKVAYKGIVPQDYLDALPTNYWSKTLATSAWDILVMSKNNKYIGTASLCPARDESMEGWGEIISIYLLPAYYHQGYGTMLLNRAIQELELKGFKKIYLWVFEENYKAQKFYEHVGFQKSKDRLSFEIGGKKLYEIRYVLCL